MKKKFLFITMTVMLSMTFCVTTQDLERRIDASRPAADALRAGRFADALSISDDVIGHDGGNSFAFLVRAIARYVVSVRKLSDDFFTVINRDSRKSGFDLDYLRAVIRRTNGDFAMVDSDLEKASQCKDVFLDLSPARWVFDWNRNGEIDGRDTALLEIELDAEGKPLPADDPRRRPMYRYDLGDVHWARAFVNFQIAALNIVMAYDWSEINRIIREGFSRTLEIRMRLLDKDIIAKARKQILTGIDCAERSRLSYLAETDDEREWIPNPRQKDHPMPLPVDDELYKTWEGVLGDLRKLVKGEECLRIADVAELAQIRIVPMPRGYIDFGRMFDRPKDIVININELAMLEKSRDIEGMLRSVFGEYYAYDKKPSLITSRLKRMKREIDTGFESFDRKLRYLLWLN